ncbi:alpha-L-iduronidase [Lucilia sericata]|uniref:alpha-L-iduronidase n=1 Tax=Lucilia sericata TaxID=13632 RepID=UPI0018A7EBD3|nr:alpha-L-iduronidase [Lucilia sericata]
MAGSLMVIVGALSLSNLHRYNYTCDTPYYNFPKFWTNTGLCPAGRIIHEDIKDSLLSDAMQMNLLYISALPRGSITHIRIHWLLELLQFEQYTQSGVPIYDFNVLDKFLMELDEMDLNPVIEFMANLSNVFLKNPTQNDFYWENLSYQVTKHYLNMFGAKKVLNWRFETWNEPDLRTYNILNFSVEDYLTYIQSLHFGLKIAGTRPVDSLHIPLRGPAGLFKTRSQHLLCWSVLEFCNEYLESCPIETLTYHRKGSGENASVVLNNSKHLLKKIYEKYPNLQKLPISNDESDPISGWSTPRNFQADVRYAVTLVNIILEHWKVKLTNTLFSKLETISHDNAFLSYHPYEFSQRTLLAHFRMNNTIPQHSQFIQKPVYAALGLMSRLANMASDVLTIKTKNDNILNVLKTIDSDKYPLYYCWLIIPIPGSSDDEIIYRSREYIILPQIHVCDNEIYAFIIEYIDQGHTNPFNVWLNYNSPPYPNATIREMMRRQQTPKILTTGTLTNTTLTVNLSTFKSPWLMLLRICSILKPRLKCPQNLLLTPVTHNEVLLTWQEIDPTSVQCLKTYDVWFRTNNTQPWINISSDWHLPFPSFHFAPSDGVNVNGFYKVRGIDIFNNTSLFSNQVQYIEIK